MKTLLILLTTLTLLNAGHIEEFAKEYNYETSYKKALIKAKAENKKIMLVMVTHYCPWCRKFERKTLNKESINILLSKNFVKLILNREKHEFPDKFDTPRIPTTYFINSKDESIINTTMGYKDKESFNKIVNTIIKK